MSSRLAILPSVNRNLPQVFDQNGFGLVAYGSRYGIYVLDFRISPPLVLDNKVIRSSHRGKVLSLSFCKCSDSEFLASSGEDRLIKVWELETASCIASIETKEYSRAVEWIYDSTSSVVFSDMNGFVAKWNFRTNKVIKMKAASEIHVVVLSSNPKCPQLLAAGHGSGTVSIFNVVNQTLLHKLRTHSMEICSLSWSPILTDVLLSTSADQSARVWKLGEDKPLKTYYYPSSRNKNDDKKSWKVCAIFHPENPDVIISSNVRGDLGFVTFKEKEPPKFTSYNSRESDGNFKSVITMLPYLQTKDNKGRLLLMTCDHLKISLWDIIGQRLISTYPFLIGNLFELLSSAINPNLLAICSGDGTLKVWNVASAATKLEMTVIYVHFKVKIMTAAWHPVDENIIAYATDEGRIGIADTFRKKSMYSFETHHSGTVYGLQWGPCCKIEDSKADFFLYSCGGGVIYIHELNKPKEKALDFDTLIELPPDLEVIQNQRSEICWKSDYTCFAVGTYKGCVDLFNGELSFIARFSIQIKTIESLRWHPLCTFASPNGSPYKAWLAAAGNDETIHIVDTADTSGQSESTIYKSTKTLIGHKKRVSSMSWSQHADGHLASGSRDGTVQVWNVITSSLIVNYSWHKDLIFAVQWSILDPDVIYSGGTDSCLRVWNISTQTETCPPMKSMVVKYKPLRGRFRESTIRGSVTEINNSEEDLTSEVKTVSNEIKGVSPVLSDEVSDMVNKDDIQKMKTSDSLIGSSQHFSKRAMHLFTEQFKSYCKEEHLENVIKLVDHLCLKADISNDKSSNQFVADPISNEDAVKLGFFSDQLTALKMLDVKAESAGVENKDKASFLHLMACNIKPLLVNAAESKSLTDFLVATAPSVSFQFWYEMCEKYAIQLVEEEQYSKASMYLLLCGKLYEAVNILSEKGRILEALALAKARLPETDPIMKGLFRKAAKHFSLQHLIEVEASCYLALKDPLQAAKILYCGVDAKYIYAAAYICTKFEMKEEAEAYAYFCMERCLSQADWATFDRLIEQHDNFKVFKALVRVHELIFKRLKELKKEDGVVANDVFGIKESKVQLWSGKVEANKMSLLAYLYETLISESIVLPEDRGSLQSIHEALNSMDEKRKKFEVSAEVHVSVAICATQVILTALLGDFNLATKYFNKIFILSNNIVFMPKVVCWLFLPLDVYYCNDTESFDCDIKNQDLELPIGDHFLNILKTMCNKLICMGRSVTENSVTSGDILPNLETIVQQVITVLSESSVEDSLLLYFFANYLNELQRMTKKGWKFRCYEKVTASDGKDTVSGGENCIICGTENSVIKPEASSNEDIEELIQTVLKEAEEKAQIIMQSVNEIEKLSGVHNNQNADDLEKSSDPSSCDSSNKGGIHEDDLDSEKKIVTNGDTHHENPNIMEEYSTPEKVYNESQENGSNSCVSFEKSQVDIKEGPEQENDPNSCMPFEKSQVDIKEEPEQENGSNSCVSFEKSQVDIKEGPEQENGSDSCVSFKESQVDIKEGPEQENGSNSCVSFENSQVDIKERPEDNSISTVAKYHTQCWSDVSLCYTLTKSLISIICRDEYAVLYYLQKYLHSVDNAVADLARKPALQQKAIKPSKTVDKPSVSDNCCQVDTKSNTFVGDQEQISEDLIKNGVFEETLNINKDVDISGEDSNSLQAIGNFDIKCIGDSKSDIIVDNQEQLSEDLIKKDTLEETLDINKDVNISDKDSNSLQVISDFDTKCNQVTDSKSDIVVDNQEQLSKDLIKNGTLKEALDINKDVNISGEGSNSLRIISDSDANCNQVDDFETSVFKKNQEDIITKDVKNGSMEEKENALVNTSLSSNLLPDTYKPDVLIKNGDSKIVGEVIISDENKLSYINILNDSGNSKTEVMVENGKYKSLDLISKTSTNEADISACALSKDTQDTISSQSNNQFSPKTDAIFKQKLVTAEELQNEHKRILEQIKLLESKEFFYPCPFDAATNIIGICCNIFQKNPCKIVQEKFHAVAHQVIQWKDKFNVEDKPLQCEICQKTFTA